MLSPDDAISDCWVEESNLARKETLHGLGVSEILVKRARVAISLFWWAGDNISLL
jgi:hypothetical protein